jgi:hypothetical protein
MPQKTEKQLSVSWNTLLNPLAAVFLLSCLVGYFVPGIPSSTRSIFTGNNPLQLQQVVALMLVTAITVVFLAFYRAKFSFSTKWLTAAVIYNALIVFVKFTLSTNQYTKQTVTSFSSILSTALLVGLLYIAAFFVLYLFFDGKLLNRTLHKALIVSRDGKVLLAMGLFVCVTLARILVFRLPILSNTAASSYLGDVFKANTALLSGLLFVMILAAVEAYAQVRRKTDLKYFFVMGLFLVLTFHIAWAIFIFRSFS